MLRRPGGGARPAERAADTPGSNAAAPWCTSQRQSAHVTESRIVQYRWHPWHGRAVFIVGAFAKAGHAVYRCVLERTDESRALEIPQWMFDAAVCCRIALAPAPSVTCEALRELRRLIDSACRAATHAGVLQAEHLSTADPGGAYATRESSAIDRSVGVVSSAGNDATVDGLAAGGAPAGAPSVGKAATRTSPRSARQAARSGDAR